MKKRLKKDIDVDALVLSASKVLERFGVDYISYEDWLLLYYDLKKIAPNLTGPTKEIVDRRIAHFFQCKNMKEEK